MKNEGWFSCWFDNSENGDVSGQFERLRGWSRVCTPPQECCRLPPTYFCATWHQTRSFLISVKNEKWSFWLVRQFRKRRGVWAFWVLAGLIPGCTPPQERCRLPPTYFWTAWHQTGAFLILVKNEKWSGWLVWHFRKRWCVWAFWALPELIPWLHSASGTLQTTAYLLLNHMALN